MVEVVRRKKSWTFFALIRVKALSFCVLDYKINTQDVSWIYHKTVFVCFAFRVLCKRISHCNRIDNFFTGCMNPRTYIIKGKFVYIYKYICTYIHIWLIEKFLRKSLVKGPRFHIRNTYFLHKIKKICLSAFLFYCLNNFVVCVIHIIYL